MSSDAEPAEFSDADRRLKRRWQLIATGLLVLAAAGTFVSARMNWAITYAESDVTEAANFYTKGSDWSPWLIPVAVFYLAAIGALFALSGVLLRIAAVLIAIAGGASIIPALSLLQDGTGNLYAVEVIDMPSIFEPVTIMAEPWPAYLLIVAAVCAIAAGYAMLRSARGPGMSSKYSSPAARRAQLEEQVFAERERRAAARERGDDAPAAGAVNERVLWDSLDHGLDPTDDDEAGAERARDRDDARNGDT